MVEGNLFRVHTKTQVSHVGKAITFDKFTCMDSVMSSAVYSC
jgi:hypothetical protein